MFLLTAIFSFILGFWCCNSWKDHRANHYKKQLSKVIFKADKVNAANSQLIEIAKRVEKYERIEVLDDMEIGLSKALADMNAETT